MKGKHFLLPRTDIAPEFLKKNLEKSGAKATEVIAYRTLPPSKEAKKALKTLWKKKNPVDYITFTSASTVHHFLDTFSKSLPRRQAGAIRNLKSRIVTIGPVTSQTLRSYGLKPFREAREHTIPGLVKALLTR